MQSADVCSVNAVYSCDVFQHNSTNDVVSSTDDDVSTDNRNDLSPRSESEKSQQLDDTNVSSNNAVKLYMHSSQKSSEHKPLSHDSPRRGPHQTSEIHSPLSHSTTQGHKPLSHDSMDNQKLLSYNSMDSHKPLSHDGMQSHKPLSHDHMDSYKPLSHDGMESHKPLSHESMDSQKPLSNDSMDSHKRQSHDAIDSGKPLSTETIDSLAPLSYTTMTSRNPLSHDTFDTQKPLAHTPMVSSKNMSYDTLDSHTVLRREQKGHRKFETELLERIRELEGYAIELRVSKNISSKVKASAVYAAYGYKKLFSASTSMNFR